MQRDQGLSHIAAAAPASTCGVDLSSTFPRRTNVYIDGFNLFYGCLEDGPYRWLNLAAFCQASLPGDHIHRIRYFTAVISKRPGHPNATQNQLTYLRALATIPNLTIDYGHFLTNQVRMKLIRPIGGRQRLLRSGRPRRRAQM